MKHSMIKRFYLKSSILTGFLLLICFAGLSDQASAQFACQDPGQGLAAKWTGPGLPSKGVLNETYNLKVNKSGDYTATTGAPNCNFTDTFYIVKNGNKIITHELSSDEKSSYSQAINIIPPAKDATDVYTVLLQIKQNNSVVANQQATLNVTFDPAGPAPILPGPGNKPPGNTPPVGNTKPPVNVPANYTVGDVNYDNAFGELNPLINAKSVPEFIAGIIKVMFMFIAALSVVVIIVGAFRMVMSQGNTEAVSAGKKTITWAIIGLIVALMSYSIVAILQGVLGVN